MSKTQELLKQFHEAASDPKALFRRYLSEGRKVVLTAPVYTPEEIIHSMGAVPFGVWGADIELNESKRYFPAFICSIMQSILELGIRGTYDGASAIVIPSLCDSLKAVGQNWKYAVPSIPFIPMTYPQNRKPDFGADFTRAGYQRVIDDLEKNAALKFDDEKLAGSEEIYNAHNAAMRELVKILAAHPEVTTASRSDIFKSAFFMRKEEHTALVRELIEALASDEPGAAKIPVMTTGILADAPGLTAILDDCGMQIVCDDIAAESRQYATDTPAEGKDNLDRLVRKFQLMDNCSVLYDQEKKRRAKIVSDAKEAGAKGIIVFLTKFCDPEEFDYPLIKKSCDAAGIPTTLIEVDRQMVNYEQARTAIETFKDVLE